MSIRANVSFAANPNLPVAVNLSSSLLAESSMVFWAQSAAARLTLATGNKIAEWKNRKGGAVIFSQATDAQRTTLQDNRISGLTASTNVGAGLTVPYVGPAIDWSQAFTMVTIARGGGTAVGYAGVVGKQYNSVWLGGVLYRVATLGPPQTGGIEFRHGTGTAFSPNGVVTPGNWYVTVVSFDGATTLRIRVNGVTGSSATTAGPFTNTGSFCLGAAASPSSFQFSNGDISDVMFFTGEALAGNAALINKIESYAVTAYASTFSFTPQAV